MEGNMFVQKVSTTFSQLTRREKKLCKVRVLLRKNLVGIMELILSQNHHTYIGLMCVATVPMIRNALFIMSNEITMPQWISGPLTNIYNMHNSTRVKQALLKAILPTKDVTSIPWPTVRNALAASMHEMKVP